MSIVLFHHPFSRAAGSVWQLEEVGVAYELSFGQSIAVSSDGGVGLVGAYGDTTERGVAAGSARVFILALAPDGSTCGGDAACASGFCTDGVCCVTTCGAGADDC